MHKDIKIKYFCLIFVVNSLPTRQQVTHDENQILDNKSKTKASNQEGDQSNCWMNLKVAPHFNTLDGIDKKYANARQAFHDRVATQLNSNMFKILSDTNAEGDSPKIPAGINLGGNCMVRRTDAILFFFRMKLRNDTALKVNFLENDIMDMTLRADISLKELHLIGAYERSATHTDPSVLFYAPSVGEVQAVMGDVRYKLKGNLRLQGKRFVLASVISDLVLKNDSIMMTFVNPNVSTITELVERLALDDFLERLKTDLDMWVTDYMNYYFTYFQLNEIDKEFKNYENSRINAYNKYSNYIIKQIKKRIDKAGLHEVVIPQFTLFAEHNLQIQLTKGFIRGFDTIYSRSTATGRRNSDLRYLDMTVGFSNVKIQYQIDIKIPNEPETSGHLQLNADDVTAQLMVAMVRDPETVNLAFKYIEQLKPESLVVIGEAKELISTYRQLLETNIIALMTNVLTHNLKMLGTITRCQPFLFPYNKPKKSSHDNPEKAIQRRMFFF